MIVEFPVNLLNIQLQWALSIDGVPKEGLRIEDVLVRIAVLMLVQEKVSLIPTSFFSVSSHFVQSQRKLPFTVFVSYAFLPEDLILSCVYLF